MNAVVQAVADVTPASRFTKIGAAGEDLPHDAASWEAIRDNRAGLIWTAGHKEVRHRKEADAAAKSFTAAGFNDWRLPTVEELFLLADRTRVSPAIDTNYFPECESDWYWTSTLYASSPGVFAWLVDFSNGNADWYNQNDSGLVRAVRASQ